MLKDIFLKKCYTAIKLADCQWLGDIIQDEKYLERVFPCIKEMGSKSTEYLLYLCDKAENAVFLLENYMAISAWLNDYAQISDKCILRGTAMDKVKNLTFVKNCLGVVKDSFSVLNSLSAPLINSVINTNLAYTMNAAFLATLFVKEDTEKYMKYIAFSEKWESLVCDASFGSPESINIVTLLFKMDRAENPILFAMMYLEWEKEKIILAEADHNEDFRNLIEYVCSHVEPSTASNLLMKLLCINDAKWLLKCLCWIRHQNGSITEFIYFCAEVDYNKKIIDLAVKKIRQLDPYSIELLLNFPVTYICAWLLDRMDVFSAYYEVYSDSAGYETFGKTIISTALVNSKMRFLNLLVDKQLDYTSIEWLEYKVRNEKKLMDRVNLNEITLKQLRKIIKIDPKSKVHKANFYLEDTTFFEELGDMRINLNELALILEILKLKSKQVVYFLGLYTRLRKKLKSDDTIIRCRQLVKQLDDRYIDIDMEQLNDMSDLLFLMDLPAWKRKLFAFPVSYETTIRALMLYDKIKNHLAEAHNELEVRFLIENDEICKNGLSDGLKKFVAVDESVNALKKQLGLDPDFYDKYSIETNRFFVRGDAKLALDYLEGLTNSKLRQKFIIILKAAMSDKLKELRYFGNDLALECSFNPTKQTKEEWTSDRIYQTKNSILGQISVYEDTSFSGTLSMGRTPVKTCMNYKGGSYNECLLSVYDANKKIIYISRKDSHVIGRAIIRLTKMVIKKHIRSIKELNFTDVTKEENNSKSSEEIINSVKEIPILFLERLYTPCQDKEQAALEGAMVQFAREKAANAGLRLVISADYADVEGYQNKNVGIYITKSRAGKQYLDSLGGECSSTSKEDTYVFAKCQIEKELLQTGA